MNAYQVIMNTLNTFINEGLTVTPNGTLTIASRNKIEATIDYNLNKYGFKEIPYEVLDDRLMSEGILTLAI